jgi:hypothetical protein
LTIRLPHAPQNQPKRELPASDVHSTRAGSPRVNSRLLSMMVTGMPYAPPLTFWQFVQWQL